MVQTVIVHFTPDKVPVDTIDTFLLWLAVASIILAMFASGVSIVFLVDYFKRHGWPYRHKDKKKKEREKDTIEDKDKDKK